MASSDANVCVCVCAYTRYLREPVASRDLKRMRYAHAIKSVYTQNQPTDLWSFPSNVFVILCHSREHGKCYIKNNNNNVVTSASAQDEGRDGTAAERWRSFEPMNARQISCTIQRSNHAKQFFLSWSRVSHFGWTQNAITATFDETNPESLHIAHMSHYGCRWSSYIHIYRFSFLLLLLKYPFNCDNVVSPNFRPQDRWVSPLWSPSHNKSRMQFDIAVVDSFNLFLLNETFGDNWTLRISQFAMMPKTRTRINCLINL